MKEHSLSFPSPPPSAPERVLQKLRARHIIYAVHLPSGINPTQAQDRRLREAFDAAVKDVLGCSNISMRTRGSVDDI